MERYERYKDSGVKWIGEIPGHWGMYKLKYLFKLNKNKNIGNKCNTILSLSYGKIKIKKDLNEGLTPESYESYQLLSTGDIVIRSTDLQNDHTSLRTGLVKIEGAITSAYIGLKNLDMSLCDSRFYHYFLHDWDITKAIYNQGKGLRQSLNWDDIKNMLIPVLDISEQTAIANYLDSTTAKIDEAIAQQQKMIDLLNERKQIIINNAVTKGLNPDAPMKDSGVEWIGEIPEHWEITKLKKKSKIILGKMLSNAPGNKYEYFCAKDVHYGCADDSDLKQMFFSDTEREQYKVNYGDMLIVEGGAGAGGCAIYKGTKTAYIQNSIMIVRGNEDMVNEYICSFMQSINQRGYVEFICNKATIPHFTKEKAGGVNIAVPPIEEQNKIVKYIEKMCAPIDNAISSAAKQISLLQERKQIIINDVVTGKVKVS